MNTAAKKRAAPKRAKLTAAGEAQRRKLTAKERATYKRRMERALQPSTDSPPAAEAPLKNINAVVPRPKPPITPEEHARLRHLRNVAYYGAAAAESPLFWALERLHAPDEESFRCFREKGIRAFIDSDNYVEALTAQWQRERREDGLDADIQQIPPALFFDWAAIAIRNLDFGFFERTARLLKSVVPKSTDVIVRNALAAYTEIKTTGGVLTKKTVREKTQRNWAVWEAIKARGIPSDGVMPSERAVQQQLARVPKQDWTTIWERAELTHLPSDKGGAPRKADRLR